MCFICMVCLQEIRACEYKENKYMNLLFCVVKAFIFCPFFRLFSFFAHAFKTSVKASYLCCKNMGKKVSLLQIAFSCTIQSSIFLLFLI